MQKLFQKHEKNVNVSKLLAGNVYTKLPFKCLKFLLLTSIKNTVKTVIL